jgi:hypothetical protein
MDYREGAKERSYAKKYQFDLISSRNFAPSLLRGNLHLTLVILERIYS